MADFARDKEFMEPLYKAFDQVWTRKGRAGFEYNYIRASDAIDRLNRVFGLIS